MHVEVNGTRLFVDVEGPGLVPDGAGLRETPTLVLLHGGPAADHSAFKPLFSALSDVVQVLYVDQRGCGRSAESDPATWTLDQWGDDVGTLCDVLGVRRPIVLGVSFGGYVAQSYATRHPDHPSGLVLVSTAARMEFEAVYAAFARLGGEDVARIARERWTHPTPESRAAYRRRCVPLYRPPVRGTPPVRRTIEREAVALHFSGAGRELMRMDFRSRPVAGALSRPGDGRRGGSDHAPRLRRGHRRRPAARARTPGAPSRLRPRRDARRPRPLLRPCCGTSSRIPGPSSAPARLTPGAPAPRTLVAQ